MRDELHLMELVDRYLDGSMSGPERAAFEARSHSDPELRELLDDQRNMRDGLERIALRQTAAKAYTSYRYGKGSTWAGGTLILAVITATVYFVWKAPASKVAEFVGGERTTAEVVPSGTDDLFADTIVLNIAAERDTTVLSPNGIVLDIPHGSFVDAGGNVITGNVRIDLVESFSGATIMKAGLSTMSGDTVLETGGMFHLQASFRGRPVNINPEVPLVAMVPADPTQQGMMLYAGVKTATGMIDWRDPKPLKRTLIPVDISTLDFYPPGYIGKLGDLGQDAANKAFADSLYRSFTRVLNQGDGARSDSMADHSSGQWLFETHCHSCHKSMDNATGPALFGARERWEGRGDINEFVRNSQRVIHSGNSYAKSLFQNWNKTVMPPNTLTEAEIDRIMDWVESDGIARRSGIDPAKVMTIWTERFNNTNLATHAFEERMPLIHATCDSRVLDAYVNDLDEELSSVDARMVRMGHRSFSTFARRGDGKVELTGKSGARLARLYAKWSKAAKEAARKTQQDFWDEQAAEDQTAQERQDAQAQQRFEQDLQRFEREYAANLSNACEQLGIAKDGLNREPPTLAYEVVLPRSGYWNIDKSSYWVSAEAANIQFINPTTQKKVTVGYAPFTVTVPNRERFDEVSTYLVPRELRSYQRMTDSGHLFRENLNKTLTYDVVCLAQKNGENHLATQAIANGVLEVELDPRPVTDSELEHALNRLGKEVGNGLAGEARYASWLRTDTRRRTANRARVDLYNAMLPVVLPCGSIDAGIAANRRLRDRPARYPYGKAALTDLLTVSLRNEFDPQERYIEGRVEVEFWILEDGTVYAPRIAKVLYPSCDKKALSLFKGMPKWQPAIRNGKPIPLKYASEVVFVRDGVRRTAKPIEARE